MRLYLYLARRDKGAINVISIFESAGEIEATRLSDSSQLGLPSEEAIGLQRIFDENQMEWEPWLETAKDYVELKNRLEKRNYKNVPGSCKPIHKSYAYTDPYSIEAKFKKKPTMLRRSIP